VNGCSWLHSLPEVLTILDQKWGEEPISPNNISQWRLGGYQDWLKRNDKVFALRTLSDYSLKLAQAAGGSISEGAAAIAGGKILELIEKAAEAENTPIDDEGQPVFAIGELIESLTSLRSAEIQQKRTNQRDVVLQQRDRQLALEEQRFQRQTAELFLKWYDDQRAVEILAGKGTREVKMENLVQLMFGEKPG